MTLFRASRDLWSPTLASIPTFDGSRRPRHKETGAKKKVLATPEKKKSTQSDIQKSNTTGEITITSMKEKDDREEYFQVALTSNAIRCMVHGAATTTSDFNVDPVTHDDGEGMFFSTKPTVHGPFVIRIYNLERQQRKLNDKGDKEHGTVNPIMFSASLTDGRKGCFGAIVQTTKGRLENLSECIVSVSGFVVGMVPLFESDIARGESVCYKHEQENPLKEWSNVSKQAAQNSPYIFITRYEILYEKLLSIQYSNGEGVIKRQICTENDEKEEKCMFKENFHFKSCIHQKRGRLAKLLSSTTFRMKDFIGGDQVVCSGQQIHNRRTNLANSRSGKVDEDGLQVSNFIEQHSDIMALKRRKENASLLSSSLFSLMLGSLKYFQNYTSAINEFDQLQKEEQFTSLSDLMEEIGVDGSVSMKDVCSSIEMDCHEDQSWKGNKETLEYALQCKDEALSSELILRWHTRLVSDGSEHGVQKFRSKKVLGEFCDALEHRWFPNVKEGTTNATKIASSAAAAMLGFLDIVPFEVGNQRLARIILNWTLRRAGLPFCITLYSNREEKLKFISVIELTSRNLSLVPQGYVDEAEMILILRSTGGLTPLVSYLLDRMAQAVTNLCLLVEKKSIQASEETDARLVRLAREKAAEGSCIICFDDKPNITTVCCGKPMHLNCLAEWLKSNSSCPQCRSDLPPLTLSQASHRRRDDRRVEYGRERISMRDFSTEEFLFHSSSSASSDDSPSSSSSSSSESSAFFYSGLDYGVNDIQSDSNDDDDSTRSIRSLLPTRSDTPTPFQSQPNSNYITSDEEGRYGSERGNEDASSTDSYRSETDDDIDRYSFDTTYSQRSLHNYSSDFELARNDDIEIVSNSRSTVSREITEDGYSLSNEDNSDHSDNSSYRDYENSSYPEDENTSFQEAENFSYREEESTSRETTNRTSSSNNEFTPFRMSFLDPELLGSVQNGPNGRRSGREIIQEDDGNADSIPEFARPAILHATDDDQPSNVVANSCIFPTRRRQFAFPRRSG